MHRSTAVVVALLLAGCGTTGGREVVVPPSVSAAPTPRATPLRAATWPDVRTPAAGSCIDRYPAGLGGHANAFDATVTHVVLGEPDADAAGTRATIALDVHEVFAGPPRSRVTMRTWDFMLPADPQDAVGVRVLLAADEALDLKACGYSRPYAAADAAAWRAAFTPAPSPTRSVVPTPVVVDPGAQLWGTRWRAVERTRAGRPLPFPAGAAWTLRFDRPSLGWRGGCNASGAPVVISADRLTVEEPAGSTAMGCDQTRMAEDGRAHDFLTADPSWQRSGDALVLTSGSTVVRFAKE